MQKNIDENLERIKGLIENNIIFERKTDYIKERNRLETYFYIGKEIVSAIGVRGEYGKGLLKEYSKELTSLYGRGYDYTNLVRMRQLYLTFKKVGTVSQQLSWSHYYIILSIKETGKRNYYINLCIHNRLTVRQLKNEIKSESYERLKRVDKEKIEIIGDNYEVNILDMIKDPIIIECDKIILEKLDEKLLKDILVENISKTLLELGVGFAFIGVEQKIKVGNNYRFIDIVLFNVKLNCYVLIELKINKLDIKDIGQIKFYVNYYDDEIKEPFHNKTIGILITKEADESIIKYSKNKDIYTTTYKINN